jgi:hypothetical protein
MWLDELRIDRAVGFWRRTDLGRFNALRHGVLSRYTVPWENADEYRAIVTALVADRVLPSR